MALFWAIFNLVVAAFEFKISTYYPRESLPWYLFVGSGYLLLILSLLAIAILFGFFSLNKLVQIVAVL